MLCLLAASNSNNPVTQSRWLTIKIGCFQIASCSFCAMWWYYLTNSYYILLREHVAICFICCSTWCFTSVDFQWKEPVCSDTYDKSWTLVKLLRSFSGQIYKHRRYLWYVHVLANTCNISKQNLPVDTLVPIAMQGSAFKQVAKELSFMLQMADVNCGLVRKESKRLQSLLPLCATGAAKHGRKMTKDDDSLFMFVAMNEIHGLAPSDPRCDLMSIESIDIFDIDLHESTHVYTNWKPAIKQHCQYEHAEEIGWQCQKPRGPLKPFDPTWNIPFHSNEDHNSDRLW